MFRRFQSALEDSNLKYYYTLLRYHQDLNTFHRSLLKREQDLNQFQEMLQADFRSLQEVHDG